jgi:putative thioredoxin
MNVDSASFEREVLEASKSVPVLVDFWAPWCAPCRALGPILEKLEAEYGGRFRLTKVNLDENPGLATAFGVRSIPDVFAFRGGKAVSHFLGALPEAQVRAFIEKVLPPRELALAERAIAERRLDEAERLLAGVKPDIDWDERVETLRQAIAFARASGGEAELAAKVAANPGDLESRLLLAGAYAARRAWREAMEQLLEILRRDRAWRDGEARKRMLAIFNLAAAEPDLVAEYRRKLAGALY